MMVALKKHRRHYLRVNVQFTVAGSFASFRLCSATGSNEGGGISDYLCYNDAQDGMMVVKKVISWGAVINTMRNIICLCQTRIS